MGTLIYECHHCGLSGELELGMYQERNYDGQGHKEWYECPQCGHTVTPVEAESPEHGIAEVLAKIDALEQRLEGALSYANVRIPMLVEARDVVGVLASGCYGGEDVRRASRWLAWYDEAMPHALDQESET